MAKKVSVWCGFTADIMIGSYFYEETKNKEAVSATVNYEEVTLFYSCKTSTTKLKTSFLWSMEHSYTFSDWSNNC